MKAVVRNKRHPKVSYPLRMARPAHRSSLHLLRSTAEGGGVAFNGTGSGPGVAASLALGFVEYSLCGMLRRTPGHRCNWAEAVGGREGPGMTGLQNFGGRLVLR